MAATRQGVLHIQDFHADLPKECPWQRNRPLEISLCCQDDFDVDCTISRCGFLAGTLVQDGRKLFTVPLSILKAIVLCGKSGDFPF